METKKEEKRIDGFFKVTISLKGAYALLEIFGGAALLAIAPATLTRFITLLTQSELLEDPRDYVANTLVHFSNQISLSTTTFVGLYLLLNGIIKVFLVWALLKNKIWAYPVSFVILGLFIIYQLYRLSFAFSLGLSFLVVFDAIVIWLIWKEYKNKLD